jgi:hypothetical protein
VQQTLRETIPRRVHVCPPVLKLTEFCIYIFDGIIEDLCVLKAVAPRITRFYARWEIRRPNDLQNGTLDKTNTSIAIKYPRCMVPPIATVSLDLFEYSVALVNLCIRTTRIIASHRKQTSRLLESKIKLMTRNWKPTVYTQPISVDQPMGQGHISV